MKHSIFFAGIGSLVMLIMACADATSKDDNPATADTTATASYTPAKEGDSVWVIINHIKPDGREKFERFIHQSFWPMAKMFTGKDREVFERTRILKPASIEADSTYTYIFIMDPAVPGGNYSIGDYLQKMYGEKASAYEKDLNEATAREQTQYRVLQDKYYRY